jgi:hypothetical protein
VSARVAVLVCPCCGHRALAQPRGSAPCEVCGWDERARNNGGWVGEPRSGLADAQREFARSGACDRGLRELTRPARADEARPSWWLAIDDAPAVLIPEIEAAFAGVMLDGGVSLAEAELIDDYAMSSRGDDERPPPGHIDGPPWQELTTAALDRFPWGNFAFQDARGLRYHLPAFMRADLSGVVLGAIDSLLFTLASHHRLAALHRLLTDPQRRAVARYVAWVAMRDAWHRVGAPWAEHLDPELRAMMQR